MTPAARAWLVGHGVPDPATIRLIPTATTADLFVVDDLVLRWYGDVDFLIVEPDALEREVAALTSLADTTVPAPRLVAWTEAPPALLMTHLDGEHRSEPTDPAAVGALLDAIHRVEPGPLARWSYRGYHEGVDLPPPAWWRDRSAWDRAVEVSSGGPPTYEPVVIHRDFHPGNLLWASEGISGIVDWGNACLGPAAFDLAHFRINLATLGGQAATDVAFPGDPSWDIEAALGYLDPWSLEERDAWVGPWPAVPPAVARERVETFVAEALAALG
ncbi:MAG TPA: aminoglycoside phosphotransferase family protein [Candidatus Limnocylindrales bacterium]